MYNNEKMKKVMKTRFNFMKYACLFLMLMGVSIGANAAEFSKIITVGTLVDGDYIIVAGTAAKAMTDIGDDGKWAVKDVTITGSSDAQAISSSDATIVWQIKLEGTESGTNYYSISRMDGGTRKYIRFTGTSNNNQEFSATLDNSSKFSVSVTSKTFYFLCKGRSSRYLKYSTNTNPATFGNFGAGSGNTQYLRLFKASGVSTYTVTYDANGATSGTVPTDASSPYNEGSSVTVKGNTGTLAKTDYAFNGWNTAANGSGTAYAVGAKFTINANTTLYAQWRRITYTDYITSCCTQHTITCAAPLSYGSVSADVTGACEDDVVSLTATPDDGYRLQSWDVYKTGTPATKVTVTDNQFTMPDYDVTVSATFEEIPGSRDTYKDALHGNADIIRLGTNYTIPTLSSEDRAVSGTYTTIHYKFIGWTAEATKATPTGNLLSGSTRTADGTTFYAVWAKETGAPGYDAAQYTGATIENGTYIIEYQEYLDEDPWVITRVLKNSTANNGIETTDAYTTSGLTGSENYLWEVTNGSSAKNIKALNKASMYWVDFSSTTLSLGNTAAEWTFAKDASDQWTIANGTRYWQYQTANANVRGYATPSERHKFYLYKLSPSYSFGDYTCEPRVIEYNINKDETTGTIAVGGDKTQAESGTLITFTVTPNSGYSAGTPTVTGASGSVSVTNNAGTYSFTMPDEDVTIDAGCTCIEYKVSTNPKRNDAQNLAAGTYISASISSSGENKCSAEEVNLTIKFKTATPSYASQGYSIVLTATRGGSDWAEFTENNATFYNKVTGDVTIPVGELTGTVVISYMVVAPDADITVAGLPVAGGVATVKDTEGNTLTHAAPGTQVILGANVNSGYFLDDNDPDSWVVTKTADGTDGPAVAGPVLAGANAGKYYFTMPNYPVTVTAGFTAYQDPNLGFTRTTFGADEMYDFDLASIQTSPSAGTITYTCTSANNSEAIFEGSLLTIGENGTYTIHMEITADDENHYLAGSADVNIKVLPGLNTPTNLGVNGNVFTWTDNNTNESGYSVILVDEHGVETNYDVAANITTKTITGLNACDEYEWYVVALGDGVNYGNSPRQNTPSEFVVPGDYAVMITLEHCSLNASAGGVQSLNPMVCPGQTIDIYLTPDPGYSLPTQATRTLYYDGVDHGNVQQDVDYVNGVYHATVNPSFEHGQFPHFTVTAVQLEEPTLSFAQSEVFVTLAETGYPNGYQIPLASSNSSAEITYTLTTNPGGSFGGNPKSLWTSVEGTYVVTAHVDRTATHTAKDATLTVHVGGYQLFYNGNGGTIIPTGDGVYITGRSAVYSGSDVYPYAIVTAGSTVNMRIISRPAGKVLQRWSSNAASFTGNTFTMPSQKTVVNAVWEDGDGYFVTVYVNAEDSEERFGCLYTAGSTDNICEIPTRDGYRLKGFYTARTSGTKVFNADGSMILNVSGYTDGSGWSKTSDATLYAQWTTESEFTITYNMNGGENEIGAPTSFFHSDLNVALPTNPTKTGYDFGGWYTNAELTAGPVTQITTDGSKTYWAKWNAQTYNITYKDRGNTDFSGTHGGGYPTTHTYGTATPLVAPTKDCYDFGGWFYEYMGGTAKTEVGATDKTENFTLFAEWTLARTDVTVYANNETDEYTVCSVAIGSSANCCYAPTYVGYALDGFYTEEVGGVKIYNADGTMVMNVTNYTNASGWNHTNPTATLYAHWTANNYTITFENEDHSVLQNTAFAYGSTPVYSGATPTKAETAQYTYTFAGWTPAITTVTGAATYTATYNQTVRSYTVTFVRNGHGSTNPASQLVEYGSKVTDPVYDVANYDVEGWYDDATYGTKWNFATDVVTGPLTLYAHWVGETYNITYKDRGNTDFSGTHEPGYPTTHTYGTATTLDTPTKTGYTFYGWYYASEGGSKLSGSPASVGATTKTEDFTLYAQWTANTYTVAYNANGGTGSMSNSSHTYDVAKNLTANKFIKTGYTFSGWNTAADGSGMAYTDGLSVINLTATPGATVTLYAQWTINQYNVTYHHAGADHVEPVNYNANPTGFTPDECAADRVFVGWSEAPVATTQTEPTTVVPTTFSITDAKDFYAVYASRNGGKAGEPTSTTEDFNSYETSSSYNATPIVCGDWTIVNACVSSIKDVTDKMESNAVVIQKAAGSESSYMQTTNKVEGLKGISCYIATTENSVQYSVQYSTDGSLWKTLAASGDHLSDRQKKNISGTLTECIDAYVRIVLSSATSTGSTYRMYVDDIELTTQTRSYYLTDYATSCEKAASITLTYDAQGGTAQTAVTEAGWVTLPTAAECERGCYTLTGWQSDLDGLTYEPGAKYLFNHDVTMTAQWTVDTEAAVTVTYHTGLEGATTQTVSGVHCGDVLTESEIPTPAACGQNVFVGWAIGEFADAASADDLDKYVVGTAVMGDMDLHAIWKKGKSVFTKYTKDGEPEDGTYIIVDHNTVSATAGKALNSMLGTVDVEIAGTNITTDDQYIQWTITKTANGYSVQSVNGYLDITADKTQAMGISSSLIDTWNIAESSTNGVYNMGKTFGASDRRACYNSTKQKWVSYKNRSTGQLYKQSGDGPATFTMNGVCPHIYHATGVDEMTSGTGVSVLSAVSGEITVENGALPVAEKVSGDDGFVITVNPVSTGSNGNGSLNYEYSVKFTPTEGNRTYTASYRFYGTGEDPEDTNIVPSDEITFTGYSLPDQFAIAILKEGKYYALPGDATSAANPAALPIDVIDGQAINVDAAHRYSVYTGTRTSEQRSTVRLKTTTGALWATNASQSTIYDFAGDLTANTGAANINTQWTLERAYNESTDAFMGYHLVSDANKSKGLFYKNAESHWGYYGQNYYGGAGYEGEIFFLPVLTLGEPMEIVDWTNDKVVLNVTNLNPNQTLNAKVGAGEYGGALTRNPDRTVDVSVASMTADEYLTLAIKHNGTEKSNYMYKIPHIVSGSTTSSTLSLQPTSVILVKSGTLTVNANLTVNTVYVYPGAKLLVNNYITLKADKIILRSDPWQFPNLENNGTINAKEYYYTRRIADKSRYYQFASPYEVVAKDIVLSTGVKPAYSSTWVLKSYSGALRATNGMTNNANWVEKDAATNVAAMTGYEMWSNSNYYREYMFPYATARLNDASPATISLTAHPAENAIDDGWNFVVSPLTYDYTVNSVTGFNVVPANPSEQPKLAEMYDDGLNYYQFPVLGATIRAFSPFYYQAASDGTMTFGAGGALSCTANYLPGASFAPARQAAVEEEVQEQWLQLFIEDADATTDQTNIYIKPKFSVAYETGLDVVKMSTTGTRPFLYTQLPCGNLAFAAIPDSLAETRIPLGVFAAADGPLTFSLRENDWLSRLDHVFLVDETLGFTTDLLTDDYTYEAVAGTATGRFYLRAEFRAPGVATDISDVDDGGGDYRIHISDGHISLEGLKPGTDIRMYDAVGHLMFYSKASSEHMSLSVPATGVYVLKVANTVNKVVLDK